MKRLLIMASIATLLARRGLATPSSRRRGGGRRMDRPDAADAAAAAEPRGTSAAIRVTATRRIRADGQLTPDERRQLRRDIGDHGRDVYRDRQPTR